MTGKTLRWDDSKGYGFVQVREGVEAFVHYTEIQDEGFKTLQIGQVVQFDLYESDKGLEARNVRKV